MHRSPRHHMRVFLALFCSFFVIPSVSANPKGFDVNDVTLLFPLDAADQPVPNISLDDDLLRANVFSNLMREATNEWISAPPGASLLRKNSWKIVGVRFDPCAPQGSFLPNDCIEELRLVAQLFGSFGPSDSTMHLIYRLSDNSQTDVVKDLLRLKEEAQHLAAVSGLPLMVHPGLHAAMIQMNPEFPKMVEIFVRKHARSERLHIVTMMGLRDGAPTDWIFLDGVVKDEVWSTHPVPNVLGAKSSFVRLNLGGTPEPFFPKTIDASLSLESFFNANAASINTQIVELGKVTHRIENPDLSNRLSVDCVSCHSSSSVRLATQFKFKAYDADLSAKTPIRITGFPGPQMLNTHPSHWNLRSLGYFGINPSISMRTVNESARVAAHLNEVLGLDNPGKDCSDVHETVLACFVDSSRLFGVVKSSEECLKICRD